LLLVVVARRAVAIIVLESIRGHLILVWGSPYRFGDPQTKTGIPKPKWRITKNPQTDSGIPEPKWGSIHPHTKTGIPESVWGLFSH
jgi:hypothetical protein